MAQTRSLVLVVVHGGETFASVAGEAALRLAFLVVLQFGGVAKNTDAASDEALDMPGKKSGRDSRDQPLCGRRVKRKRLAVGSGKVEGWLRQSLFKAKKGGLKLVEGRELTRWREREDEEEK